jgi:hypothetical protein
MPTQPRITPRGGLLAVLALAPLASALTACGAGPGGDEDKIAKTTSTYLRALADGDTATACAQLTRRAKGDRCRQALEARLARLSRDQLRNAADASLDIDTHGTTATTRLGEPRGARLRLVKVGADWRIDSGYALGAPASGVRPGVGMAGIELDMTPAQVRAIVGRPTDRTPPGPNVETEYRYGEPRHPRLLVTFSAHQTVRQIIGSDRSQQTQSGVGVGSTERALRKALHGERCYRPYSGALRQCELRRQANGENRTTSFIFGDSRRHPVLFVVIAVEPSHRPTTTSPPARTPLP